MGEMVGYIVGEAGCLQDVRKTRTREETTNEAGSIRTLGKLRRREETE